MKNDVPDIIDEIYDCVEKHLTEDDALKTWLRAPHEKLPHNMSPNEMLKAGKAGELLKVVRTEFGCDCSSTPQVSETLQ